MAEWDVELSWICKTCTTVVLGRHDACTHCGSPHTDEAYLMPDDVALQEHVTDPRLIEMSRAGENWSCKFCGSSQRARSGACARCGGEKTQPTALRTEVAHDEAGSRGVRFAARQGLSATTKLLLVSAALFCAAIGTCAVTIHRKPLSAGKTAHTSVPPTEETFGPQKITAQVTGGSFRHRIVFEKKELGQREGFDVPKDALHVEPRGSRVHHTDHVQQGFTTEPYSVVVPDGYRTESYSERVSCGEDCTDRPQTCRKECTNKKNGFASCKDVCSGGGRTCTTRYCNQTKTRQIPKTRTETRTRQIPKYIDVPVSAPYFGWKEWIWVESHFAESVGEGKALSWPTTRPATGERDRREASYTIQLTTKEGKSLSYAPPDETSYLDLLGRAEADIEVDREQTTVRRVLP